MAQTSWVLFLINLLPWTPRGSWLTAITSIFVKISLVASDILRISFPAIRGAARSDQRLKWAILCLFETIPTINISGSFQCPGPAYFSSPTCLSRIFVQLNHEARISGVVLQSCPPTSFPQTHGCSTPQLQMLKTISLPEALRASPMALYFAVVFSLSTLWVDLMSSLVKQKSYFRKSTPHSA